MQLLAKLCLLFALLSVAGCGALRRGTTALPAEDFATNGRFAVLQGATSDSVTHFTIVRPRRQQLSYEVQSFAGEELQEVELLETVSHPLMLWHVDKLRVSGLSTGQDYHLRILLPGSDKVADRRVFRTLDTTQPVADFVIGSCMSDDFSFHSAMRRIWQRVSEQQPDFILLMGDLVYVDAAAFVARSEVSETDLWLRYLDTVLAIPLFRSLELMPILAVWDDHDFGINNGDKRFKNKQHARKVFKAMFGSSDITGVYENGPAGVYSVFSGFGQRFFLMDDRYFREPNGSPERYAHWGQDQHEWLLERLARDDTPAWIVNGNQISTESVILKFKNYNKLRNESLYGVHHNHFQQLAADLREISAPVIFASGDAHFSEISLIEKEFLGYDTYEITSSPLHGSLAKPRGKLWENSRRIAAVKDHNFVHVSSRVQSDGLVVDARAFGTVSGAPLFAEKLSVLRRN